MEYWCDQAVTDVIMQGGWLRTGDLARVDGDGFYWFMGRKKAIIVRDGDNISPAELERTLHEHPAVLDAAIVGVPDVDPSMGEMVIGFVAVRAGCAVPENELRQLIRNKHFDYCVPSKIVFLAELPKRSIGKIDRKIFRNGPWPNVNLSRRTRCRRKFVVPLALALSR